ncbi:MAG: hypothetical protein ACRCXT_04190 [Paraclostridium sp.]
MNEKLERYLDKKNIDIPKSFELKFEDTLNNLPVKNTYKKNKYMKVATLLLVLVTGTGAISALANNTHKYMPNSGVVINSESNIYGLKEKLFKLDSKGNEINLDMFIDSKNDKAVVFVGGESNIPKSEKAELKIGDKVYINQRGYVNELDDTWGTHDIFKDIDEYNQNDKITYTLYMNNKEKVEFDIRVQEIKGVLNYNELGVTSTYNNIPITAVSDEQDNDLYINFIVSDFTKDINIIPGYDSTNQTSTGIYLLDSDGTRVDGVREINNGQVKMNRIKFKTNNLKKPYKIIIPEVKVSLSENYSELESEEIIINIPKDGESLNINKDIKFKELKKILSTDNDVVEIMDVTRNKNKAIVKFKYKNRDYKDRLVQIYAIESNLANSNYLYSQSSQDKDMDSTNIIEFDINNLASNIKFKISPLVYEIKGNWQFEIN